MEKNISSFRCPAGGAADFGCMVVLCLSIVVTAFAEEPKARTADPLNEIQKGFPKSITVKNGGRLLEFCPDNTCDGFVGSSKVSSTELKNFAYLWIFYFSDYTTLEDWRKSREASQVAERLLARPEYKKCKSGTLNGKARCVLLALSRNQRIRLLFIRYDERRRNVVSRNIAKEIAGPSQ